VVSFGSAMGFYLFSHAVTGLGIWLVNLAPVHYSAAVDGLSGRSGLIKVEKRSVGLPHQMNPLSTTDHPG